MRVLPTTRVATFPRASAGIFTTCFHPNGKHLLTGGADRAVRLWNTSRQLLIHTFTAHSAQVLSVSPTSDGTGILSSGADRIILHWNLQVPDTPTRIGAHESRVNAVICTSDRVIVSAGYDKRVAMWDIRAPGRAIQSMTDATDSVTALHMRNDVALVAASVDGHVRMYDVRAGVLSTDKLGAPVTSLAGLYGTSRLFAGCLDGVIYGLNGDSGVVELKLKGHESRTFATGVTVMSDGVIAAGSEDGAVYLWDPDGGRPAHVNVPDGTPAVVAAVDAHPHDSLVATGSHDGDVVVWGPPA